MTMIVLKHAVTARPKASDFVIREQTIPVCETDSIVARVLYLSLDPYIGSRLRGRHMGEKPPEPMEEPVPGAIVGEVIETRSGRFKEGDIIHSMDGAWSSFVHLSEAQCRNITTSNAPLSTHLGVLGMPGLTAWAGVTKLANVSDGDVFLVDAAAGPVGGTAGQIARICGASHVVGIAGGDRKCRLVEDAYGFDACIDYKEDGWQTELAQKTGAGVDVFFENVSANMAMTALSVSKPYVRGVFCGLAANYHDDAQATHPINAGMIIAKRAALHGLVVYDYYPLWEEYVAQATTWISDGALKFVEDRVDGLDKAPDLFEKLVNGQNIGKCIVDLTGRGD
ncbi:MAG: NADP-dependent oxidoreductase [Pseudomonadota bacterium]